MTVWQNQFFKEQLNEAERGVNQENLGYPTSKNGPKWTYIPSSPLPKIANCGEVCASQLVPLRPKPREDDDDDSSKDLKLRGVISIISTYSIVCKFSYKYHEEQMNYYKEIIRIRMYFLCHFVMYVHTER